VDRAAASGAVCARSSRAGGTFVCAKPASAALCCYSLKMGTGCRSCWTARRGENRRAVTGGVGAVSRRRNRQLELAPAKHYKFSHCCFNPFAAATTSGVPFSTVGREPSPDQQAGHRSRSDGRSQSEKPTPSERIGRSGIPLFSANFPRKNRANPPQNLEDFRRQQDVAGEQRGPAVASCLRL
jgi:hypothetical protein